jgi:hypothetical protein
MSELTFEDLQAMNMDEIYCLFCRLYKSVHNYYPWHIKSHEMEKVMEFLEFELRPDTVELREIEKRKNQEEMAAVNDESLITPYNNQEEMLNFVTENPFYSLTFEEVSEMPIGEIYGLFCRMYKFVHNYHPWHVKSHEIEKMMEFIEFELRADTQELRQRQSELRLF